MTKKIPQFNKMFAKKKSKVSEDPPPLALGDEKFVLAPLSGPAPKHVLVENGKDPLGAFILSCAHIFNDLKDLILFRMALDAKKPSGETDAHAGQWHGMHNHVDRMLMSVLHEALRAIEEQIEVATSAEVQAYMKTAHASVQASWNALVQTAGGKAAESIDAEFREVVLKIRNSVAYHYYQPKKLVQGYRKHFFQMPISKYNKRAFVSLGKNMEESRFYFADAAAERAVEELAGEMGEGEFAKALQKFVNASNTALMHLVSSHIKRPPK